MTDDTEDESGTNAPNVIDLGAAREQLKRDLEKGTFTIAADERVDILKEMNEKHAFIVSYGGKPAISTYIHNNVYGREILEFHSPESICTTYSNRSVQEGRTTVELGKWWIKHLGRRQYASVFFDPAKPKEDNNCLNLWEGMTLIPTKGNWKIVLAHIYRILCNRDKAKFDYFIKWMAWLIQNPGQRAEIAVIFKGKQGAGKGFIFTQLVRIFGEHGISIASREHLTGKFNDHLGRTVFLFADEAYYPGDKEVEGVLKQLITEERFPTEAKFKAVGHAKNFLHIAMSTNQEWVIPAHDDSRRYFINEVDSSYAKNQTSDAERKTYFDCLWGCMDSGGREGMVYDLMKMDLTNWHPRDNMPTTSEMQNQVYLSLPNLQKLIVSFLDEGIFPGQTDSSDNYRLNPEQLNYHLEKLNGGQIKVSSVKVMGEFKKLGVKRRRLAKTSTWVFPNLSDMKAKWDDLHGAYCWENKAEEWLIDKSAY